MSRWGVIIDGALQVFDAAALPALTNAQRDAAFEVPDEFPDTLEWDGEDFVPRPPALTADEVFDLFTADEKTAILTSGIPQVVGLVLALRFLRGTIRADDPFHVNGVELLKGLGLLTEARAARVLAMLPPI